MSLIWAFNPDWYEENENLDAYALHPADFVQGTAGSDRVLRIYNDSARIGKVIDAGYVNNYYTFSPGFGFNRSRLISGAGTIYFHVLIPYPYFRLITKASPSSSGEQYSILQINNTTWSDFRNGNTTINIDYPVNLTIEVTIDSSGSTQTVAVRINGQANYIYQKSFFIAGSANGYFGFHIQSVGGLRQFLRDIVIYNNAGTFFNSYQGRLKLKRMPAIEAVVHQSKQLNAAGEGDPNGDPVAIANNPYVSRYMGESYLQTDSKDLFKLDTSDLASDDQVRAVINRYRCRAIDQIVTANSIIQTDEGNTLIQSDTINPIMTATYHQRGVKNANNDPWTKEAIDASLFGYGV